MRIPSRGHLGAAFAAWLASFSLALAAPAPAQLQAHPISTAPLACTAGRPAINEEGFVRIGGIDQWVTIKGDHCANPVILFVHGGPGNPNTVFANLPYNAWEKEFIIVQWDQRGAGRTFSRNPASEEAALTVDIMVNDGIEVASFVKHHLNAKKLILFGGSWGSVLGAHMAKARPDLFVAYIGTGQMVKYLDNDIASYRKVLAQARSGGDAAMIKAVEALGEPPWTNPRNGGILRRAGRQLEAKASMPAPKQWWDLAPAHATRQAQADYERGEDYSWIQFVGMKGNGMLSTIDLPRLGLDYKIPVFLIQGEHDLVTVPEVARVYFDSISAPQKEYFSLPNTGHDPNPEMVDMQYKVLSTRVRPLLQAAPAR